MCLNQPCVCILACNLYGRLHLKRTSRILTVHGLQAFTKCMFLRSLSIQLPYVFFLFYQYCSVFHAKRTWERRESFTAAQCSGRENLINSSLVTVMTGNDVYYFTFAEYIVLVNSEVQFLQADSIWFHYYFSFCTSRWLHYLLYSNYISLFLFEFSLLQKIAYLDIIIGQHGGAVLVLSQHIKKDPGSLLELVKGLCVWSLRVLPVYMWVSSPCFP